MTTDQCHPKPPTSPPHAFLICLFNDKNELLTVKETKRKDKKPWNLPGGKAKMRPRAIERITAS
eukprot:COSAG06_NODE_3741_length_4955_cov_47.397309_3_plen_64_part_00